MSSHGVTTEQTSWSNPAGVYILCACGWIGTVQHALDEAMEEHTEHVVAATTKRAKTA